MPPAARLPSSPRARPPSRPRRLLPPTAPGLRRLPSSPPRRKSALAHGTPRGLPPHPPAAARQLLSRRCLPLARAALQIRDKQRNHASGYSATTRSFRPPNSTLARVFLGCLAPLLAWARQTSRLCLGQQARDSWDDPRCRRDVQRSSYRPLTNRYLGFFAT
ncbi:hypothetical protein BDN70DRAFT_993769 [Pholiota conissans]|uniref:Uncharacterized protein n=1 Tax=Pholiota conissans TaxID=109636 RepID=A0A9P5Z1I1_9AGAR|nr:hypothetical protein BDN70DRAFT_993769 [Pholiota conissans]